MKTKALLVVVAFLAITLSAEAKGWKKNNNRKVVYAEQRYNHPRVNPRRVRTVTVLPHGYSQIRYNNGVYYYSKGVYYRPTTNRYYEVVLPHIGMIVPELPVYRKVVYGGRSYYSHQNYLYTPIRTPQGINFRVDIRL